MKKDVLETLRQKIKNSEKEKCTLRQKIEDTEKEKCTLRQQYTEELEKVLENIKKVNESDNMEKEKLADLNKRHDEEMKDVNPRKTGVCEYLERPGVGGFRPPYGFSI